MCCEHATASNRPVSACGASWAEVGLTRAEAGLTTTEGGLPFFSMEFVAGEPITTYCQNRKLSVDRRIAIFIDACRAIQYAHQQGVIHRDLKPAHLLVADVAGQPVPKIIDFGISKALGL